MNNLVPELPLTLPRLFMTFVSKFSALSFLETGPDADKTSSTSSYRFTDDDDLDLCLYYLRSLSNIFRWAPDSLWAILATKSLSTDDSDSGISRIGESDPPRPQI